MKTPRCSVFLLGWLIVIGMLVGGLRGSARAEATGNPSPSNPTSLAEALPFGPRPVWTPRQQQCVAPILTSWAETPRSLRQRWGPFHVLWGDTQGVALQFDTNTTSRVFFYTKEDCEYLRTLMLQEGSWTPKPGGQGGQPGVATPIQ
jgi:hypothetical protein